MQFLGILTVAVVIGIAASKLYDVLIDIRSELKTMRIFLDRSIWPDGENNSSSSVVRTEYITGEILKFLQVRHGDSVVGAALDEISKGIRERSL